MTLQNGFTDGVTAYLWSDTLFCSMDGQTDIGFAHKCFQGDSWPYAVSMATIGIAQLWLQGAIARANPPTLPRLLTCASWALRAACAAPGTSGQLLIAAWDAEARSARLFVICSADRPEGVAFEPIEAGSFASSANASAPALKGLHNGFTVARMLDLIDAQHAEPFPMFGTEHMAHIGGECLQIDVRAQGVAGGIVRDWRKGELGDAAFHRAING